MFWVGAQTLAPGSTAITGRKKLPRNLLEFDLHLCGKFRVLFVKVDRF
jgi:hypothetical protein